MLTEDTLHAENVPFEKDLAYLLFIDNLCIYGELKIAKMHILLSYRIVLEMNLCLRYVFLVASIGTPTCAK